MSSLGPIERHVGLPRDRAAAGLARRVVAGVVGDQITAERLADLQLVVSELVGNAVVHGKGEIGLRIRFEERKVHGEVWDGGGDFEHEIRERGPHDVSGRGIAIVASVVDSWGVHEGSTHVWFTLDSAWPSDEAESRPELGSDARPPGLSDSP